jgi:hypothetical protein
LRSRSQAFFDALPSDMKPADKQRRFEAESPISPDERTEMRSIRKQLSAYKSEQRGKLQSVLASSDHEEQLAYGQDNVVHINTESPDRFVTKYSSKTYPAKPATVTYMRNKYALLKRYMTPYIAQSGFFLGERRNEFERKGEQPLPLKDNRLALITVQRRVQGKTMKQMTVDERKNPTLLAQLRDAHGRYVLLKRQLREEAVSLGLPPETLDAKLDLGRLSKSEQDDTIDEDKLHELDSPNIMFDDKTGRLLFIDFGMGDWNEEKQEVYHAIMTPKEDDAVPRAA